MFSKKRGNYAYACTRVKAKKPFLLKREDFAKLALMDIPQISRFMGETQYKKEIDELARIYSGVDLVEMATYKNLAGMFEQIIDFSKGELKELISQYLRRFDVWNIKTILRGKFHQAKKEEILEDIVPAGVLKQQFLEHLIDLKTIDETIEGLKGTLYHKPLMAARKQIEEITTLMPFENNLDKAYYSFLLEFIEPDSRANKLFLRFVRKEIDTVNLNTLLKLKFEAWEGDIMDLLIEGGLELTKPELRRLASLPFNRLISELKSYSFYNAIESAIEGIERTRSLNEVIRALEKYLLRDADKFSHLYPLSVLPVVHYILAKKNEVDNIRIIARGKESGLSNEIIKKLLVI